MTDSTAIERAIRPLVSENVIRICWVSWLRVADMSYIFGKLPFLKYTKIASQYRMNFE